MTKKPAITDHYTRGNLIERLSAALIDDGVDPKHPTLEALAPYDHFHSRGLEATVGMADRLQVAADDHLLDVGSGIGGPARYMVDRFGCRVTGLDLTAEFCEVARHLNKLLSMDDRIHINEGDALKMPFDDASFDGVYSMNVSMNIANKAGLYREIRRVLRPGGWLVLSEIAKGPGGDLTFPTPWARTAATSFLATPEATSQGLKEAGFVVSDLRDNKKESKDYSARSRAAIERGEKPLHRAVSLIHGGIADQASANTSRAAAEERVIPIEVTCFKPEDTPS